MSSSEVSREEVFNEPTIVDLEGLEDENVEDSVGLLDNDVNNWTQGNPSRVPPKTTTSARLAYFALFIFAAFSLFGVLLFSFRIMSSPPEKIPTPYTAILKQSWPNTLCKTDKCNTVSFRYPGFIVSEFTRSNRSTGEDCTQNKYDDALISPLKPKLEQIWPAITRSDPYRYAWETDGICMPYGSVSDQYIYFDKSIQKLEYTNIWSRVQQKFFLTETNSTINLSDFMDIISFDSPRGRIVPLVDCWNFNGTSNLHSVYTCMESEKWEFTSCTSDLVNKDKKCGNRITFPLDKLF
jgi:hypothetical protein